MKAKTTKKAAKDRNTVTVYLGLTNDGYGRNTWKASTHREAV